MKELIQAFKAENKNVFDVELQYKTVRFRHKDHHVRITSALLKQFESIGPVESLVVSEGTLTVIYQ
ncbi:hypothetical protein GCM10028805_22760 [Spirosoma harenae]